MSEIIIDGVDVSGCVNRATNAIGKDFGTYCREITGGCKNHNCYYKQLKRAEEKNEKLKGKIIDMNSIIEDIAISLEDRNLKLTEMPFKINDIRIKMLKYTQALEEMREKCKDLYDVADKENAGFYTILQMIDEVLND